MRWVYWIFWVWFFYFCNICVKCVVMDFQPSLTVHAKTSASLHFSPMLTDTTHLTVLSYSTAQRWACLSRTDVVIDKSFSVLCLFNCPFIDRCYFETNKAHNTVIFYWNKKKYHLKFQWSLILLWKIYFVSVLEWSVATVWLYNCAMLITKPLLMVYNKTKKDRFTFS